MSVETRSAGWTETAVAPGRAWTVGAVAVAAALTALAARAAVPLPGTAVPFTLQVVAVLLSGVVLGARLGMSSQLTYLAAGMAGLPVFAAGGGLAYLLGPTGGYLLAFPVAAGIAGLAAGRGGLVWTLGGIVAGLVVIHAGGIAWLAATVGTAPARAALEPFLVGDLLKVALVLLLGTRLRPVVQRRLG